MHDRRIRGKAEVFGNQGLVVHAGDDLVGPWDRLDLVSAAGKGAHRALAGHTYHYRDAAKARVINDAVGPHPVLVYADPATRRVQTFLRSLPGRTLTFTLRGDVLMDQETGSTWDPVRGLGLTGPLRGEALRVVPHNPSFDWAWLDFYPTSEIYAP